ncbi:MAG: polysaccharide deacetylase family protein, partial [Oscillospiraceae bacterium]|nr:polysaccharide deacetylase family protein [Oscillospiraceae bacterium]
MKKEKLQSRHSGSIIRRYIQRSLALLLILCSLLTCLPIMTMAAPSQKKLIAITFDDGPSGVTGRLLDGLKARGAKATFFMLGSCAANYPNTVRRAYEEGHQICSHSYDHPALTTKNNDQVYWQMNKTDGILDGILGMDFNYTIRPPYGDVNSRVLSVFEEHFQAASIIWSVDPYDWRDQNSYTVANRVVSGSFDGAIVLVHDIYSTTVTGILSAIDTLADYGYEFVTLSELYRRRGSTLTPGENHYYCKPNGTTYGPMLSPVLTEVDQAGCKYVSISSSHKDAATYYTTDGSNPIYSKQVYTEPILVTPGTTVRAVSAYNLNGSRSPEAVLTTKKTISQPPLPPVFTIEDGKYVLQNPNPVGNIRYTVNGNIVHTGSELYTEPLAAFKGLLRCRAYTPYAQSQELFVYISENGNVYCDVTPDQWYASDVDRAVTEGLFRGMGNYRFAPNTGVNRAMFVTVLYRLMEKLGADVSYETAAAFPDATVDWYQDALSWGAENEIVKGYSDGSFGPDKQITREEMCVVLSRVMQWYGYDILEGGAEFTDGESISQWALSDVWAMSGIELIQGYSDGSFRPQNTAS